MPKINQRELSALYKGLDIQTVWEENQALEVINHPKHGLISPRHYRAIHAEKPCPFCGQRMKYGVANRTTQKSVAIARSFQYLDENGNETINAAGKAYYHPHYVTLDHKLNKARFPEKMFDADNLQIMCWKCNKAKGDNNAYLLRRAYNNVSIYVSLQVSQKVLDIMKR